MRDLAPHLGIDPVQRRHMSHRGEEDVLHAFRDGGHRAYQPNGWRVEPRMLQPVERSSERPVDDVDILDGVERGLVSVERFGEYRRFLTHDAPPLPHNKGGQNCTVASGPTHKFHGSPEIRFRSAVQPLRVRPKLAPVKVWGPFHFAGEPLAKAPAVKSLPLPSTAGAIHSGAA